MTILQLQKSYIHLRSRLNMTSNLPPYEQMRAACNDDDVERVKRLLSDESLTKSTSPEDWVTGRGALVWSLLCAVQEKASDCLRHLLKVGADVSEIYPDRICGALDDPVCLEIVQVLLDHGWDINSRKPNKPPLLWMVVGSPDKVAWCIDHGASLVLRPLAGECDQPVLVLNLLETVASRGNLDTFKSLMALGAPLGRRVLHIATRSASSAVKKPEYRSQAMEIMRYLLEDLKCDPNQLDQDLDQQLAQRKGAPLSYIAAYHVGEYGTYNVIRLLLEHGADPRVQNSFGESSLDLAMDEDIVNISFRRTIESIQAEITLAQTSLT